MPAVVPVHFVRFLFMVKASSPFVCLYCVRHRCRILILILLTVL